MRKTDTEVHRVCVGEPLNYNLKFNNKKKKEKRTEKKRGRLDTAYSQHPSHTITSRMKT